MTFRLLDSPLRSSARRSRRAAVLILVTSIIAAVPAPAWAALISEDQEFWIGLQAARELEAAVGVVRDPALADRVSAIGSSIAARSDRSRLPWRFRVLATREVNAIALPGGFIYVTAGMLRFTRSDDELAFVLSHEIAHVNQRHHVQMIERQFIFGALVALLTGNEGSTRQIAQLVRGLISRGYSRDHEFEADRVGIDLMRRAGHAPAGAVAFMERLRAAEGRDPSSFEVLFRTHPATGERLDRVRELAW